MEGGMEGGMEPTRGKREQASPLRQPAPGELGDSPSPPQSPTAAESRGLCCSPALTILSQSLRGTLETWQEQVMAEEWSGARYGAGMVGQPGVWRSMATSSSSTSTTRARGFSKPGEEGGDGCC